MSERGCPHPQLRCPPWPRRMRASALPNRQLVDAPGVNSFGRIEFLSSFIGNYISDQFQPMKFSLLSRLFSGCVSVLSIILTWQGAAASPTLEIYWADVEGGAGTLIVTPAGESVLIDTGSAGVRDPGRIHKIAS